MASAFAVAAQHKALDLLRMVIEMTTEAGSGHPSSAASLAHIVTVLVYRQMQFEPLQPDHPIADRLILSEGHACPIVYAAGADLGFAVDEDGRRRAMQPSDLLRLRQSGSPLEGHPNPLGGFPFFATATGSLGQGLSMAAGMALAARIDGIDKRVYCIVGDGESREGQVWEALDLLVDERLHSVCPIFNCNGLGQTGEVSEQQSAERLAEKLVAFGFDAHVVDGHDVEALQQVFALQRRREGDDRLLAVVARTVKGFGTKALQGDMHGKALDGEAAQAALLELDRRRGELPPAGDGGGLRARDQLPSVPAEARTATPPVLNAVPPFAEALRLLDREPLLQQPKLATRQAHGLGLQMLGRLRDDVVVLDGDVGNSTHADYFAKDDHMHGRFLQCRIGEQNMLSTAVGLAAAGKLPFVSSFGKFLVRGYDQLEMAIISGSNLKLVGSHVGVTPSADGPSQMALADVAFCRALASVAGAGGPLMQVLTPCDARSAYALTMLMAQHDGCCYLRTQRPAVPHVYDGEPEFRLGGMNVLERGDRLVVLAWGYLLHEARAAVARLRQDGIAATLVDAYSLPFDEQELLAIVRDSGDAVLTVEDNYGGGLGSAVAEALARAGTGARLQTLTVRRLPHSAREPAKELARLGLDAAAIVAAARALAGG